MCHYHLQRMGPGFRGTSAAEPGTALQQKRLDASTAHSSIERFFHHLQGPHSDKSALSSSKARVSAIICSRGHAGRQDRGLW